MPEIFHACFSLYVGSLSTWLAKSLLKWMQAYRIKFLIQWKGDVLKVFKPGTSGFYFSTSICFLKYLVSYLNNGSRKQMQAVIWTPPAVCSMNILFPFSLIEQFGLAMCSHPFPRTQVPPPFHYRLLWWFGSILGWGTGIYRLICRRGQSLWLHAVDSASHVCKGANT